MNAAPSSVMPIVGISCNLKVDGRFRHHATGEGNTVAILDAAGALPLLIPALGDRLDPDAVLDAVDGIMLTGGVSNIEPHHYGQEPAPGEDVRDPGRDALSFALVRAAIRRGVPLLGVCRGIQEMNVALGGTLHQRLHEVPGRRDHRRNREIEFEESIAPRDRLRLTPGGPLATWLGEDEAVVNSLHGQGIDRLAPRLVVEALADDGTVEAVRARDASTFAVGVQWHVEIAALEHPLNRAILKAFGDAVRRRALHRRGAVLDEAAD
ncbi:MAG: gamma-glutamyl-gamma-aminobutyrate hydrolase family protein [Immundisolibacterales bacterium]|nr:gamma-glutamyl-gamma-aminobutyrate hydrolase family protein [Immundisolibacterales bacterium]